MIPTIIHGGEFSERAEAVQSRFPSDRFICIHITAEKSSILISQILSLIQELSLTAVLPRLIWIEDAHKLTVPAQNALLKMLEEPPGKTEIVLTATHAHTLLPTIRSRCNIISLKKKPASAGDGVGLALIKKALAASAGDRIILADTVGRKRETSIAWCQNCLHDLNVKLAGESHTSAITILTKVGLLAASADADLRANVSPVLVIQNFFLALPRVRLKP